MTDTLLGPVDVLGVYAIELTHAPGEISFLCLGDDMVVIGHLTVGVTPPIEAFTHAANGFYPIFPVL